MILVKRETKVEENMRLFILVLCLALLPVGLFFSGARLPILWIAWGFSSIAVVWFLLWRSPRTESIPLINTPEPVPMDNKNNATREPQDASIPSTELLEEERPKAILDTRLLIGDIEEPVANYEQNKSEQSN